RRAADEIARGVTMVTGLSAEASDQGWVGVRCRSRGMAGWLVRAIVMENVLATHDAEMLWLPAGPDFRLEKEIKNVVTASAKTNHYWTGHMSTEQHAAINAMVRESTLMEPMRLSDAQSDPGGYRRLVDRIQCGITELLGMVCFPNRYIGWIGVECADVH